MRHIAILILSIFFISSMIMPASAATVSVGVSGLQVQAIYHLSLDQNVTTLQSVTATVDSSPGSNASLGLAQALRTVDPSASPSAMQLNVTSVKRTMNTTLSMIVAGVTERKGDILTINMTWLPFDVNSDLVYQQFSYNMVGVNYLRPIVAAYANASRYVGRPNATITGVTFFINGTSVGAPTAEDYVGNFTTLNFNLLSSNIDQWNRTYTISNDTTTWRYYPPTPLNFQMQIQRKNVTASYVAAFSYDAVISVPGVCRSQGDILVVEVGSGQTEWIMVSVLILAIISAITVQISMRGRKKRLMGFQRR